MENGNVKPKKGLWGVIDRIVAPLRLEWPFFVFAILLLRPAVFHNAYFEDLVSPYSGGMLVYLADLLTTLSFAAVATYIVAYSGRWAKQGAYLFLWALFLMSLFLSLVFDRKINMLTIQQIIETNTAESKEFISVFALSRGGVGALVAAVLFFVAIIVVEKNKERIEAFVSRIVAKWLKNALAPLLIVAILMGFLPLSKSGYYRDKILQNYPLNTVTCLIYSLYGFKEESDKMSRVDQWVERVARETVGTDEVDDSLCVIYVLGESFIKSHAQVYGYRLPTTPRLKAELDSGNLFAFTDAVSPYCSTNEMLKSTFFMNSSNEGEDWSDYPFFPQLFRKAGFFVNMCDNQTPTATPDDFDKAFRLLLHKKSLSKNSYSAVTPIRHAYDLDNILEFEDINRNNHPPRALLIFHLMGQHIYASERFPHVEPFVKFTEDDYPKTAPYLDVRHRRLMADWDNATLYNDSVVAHLIDVYRKENALLVYFSDHGEEVYDYRDCYGRHEPEKGMVGEWAHCVFDVPFFVWCSDEYKRRHPERVARIAAAVDVPFSTDCVPHMVVGLSGLSTPYYRPHLDVTNPQFAPVTRYIHSSDGRRFNYAEAVGKEKRR